MAKCVDGSPNSGTITFQELESDRTRVTATIEYEPEGFLEKTADALRIPSGRVEGDLESSPTLSKKEDARAVVGEGRSGEERAVIWVLLQRPERKRVSARPKGRSAC